MSTIFRFAIQTEERRLSEVWSFFCNKSVECIYATRTSMRDWLKISFHQSRACHIKSKKSRPGEKDFEWEHDEICTNEKVHVMRIIYGLDKLTGDFEIDKRVGIVFEEWHGHGSVYLDMFFTYDEKIVETEKEYGLVAAHCINGTKWVYFKISMGSPQLQLPEPISGMTFHMGDSKNEEQSPGVCLANATALWYSVPDKTGKLVVTEASFAKFPLDEI